MHGILAFVFAVCTSLLAAQAEQEADKKKSSDDGRIEVTIRLRMCDGQGVPLQQGGVVVGRYDEVTTTDALKAPQATCDKDGVVLFQTRVKSDRWLRDEVLLAASPGKASIRYRNPFFGRSGYQKPPTWIDLGDVRLPKAHTMIGRVRDPDGKPVVGARVVAADCLGPYPWLTVTYGAQVETDERGLFRLPGILGSAMTLAVEAEGYYAERFPSVGLGTPLDIGLRRSGFLEGTVVDATGAPASGVMMVTEEFILERRSTYRVEDGRFRIGIADPCRFKLTFYDRESGAKADSKLLDGPAQGIAIKLGERTEEQFSVRAVDSATGRPLAKIRASVFWFDMEADDNIRMSLISTARGSDDKGVVALPVPGEGPRSVGVVYVQADGYAPLFQAKVKGKPGGQFVAKMVVGAKVRGTVLDAQTGKPVAGVQVSCGIYQSRRTRQARLGRSTLVTGADGTFAFPMLGDGTYELVARYPTGTAQATKRIKAETGKDLDPVTLQLPAGVSVRGVLKGAPRGARIALGGDDASAAQNPTTSGGSVLAATNFEGAVPIVDGRFELPHRAKAEENLYLIVPQPPRQGAAVRMELQKVEVSDQDLDLEIDCSAHLPATLTGKVTFDGADVPGGRFVVVATEQHDDKGRWVRHDIQVARRRWCLLGTDGRYSIPVGRGPHTLEVIDSATGIEVLPPVEPFEVQAGKAVTRDLKVPVVEVRATFDVEQGELPARRVTVSCGEKHDLMGPMTLFGGGSHGSRGFDIPGIGKPVSFYVPPGTIWLKVEKGATRIEGGTISFGGDPLVEEQREAELGRVLVIDVPLKPASTYPIK